MLGVIFSEKMKTNLISQGETSLILDTEKLSLIPESGEPLLIPYRDIDKVTQGNYRIEISLVSKEKLTLFDLGYKYEDFYRNLSNLNNDIILKDLLMNETMLKSGVEAEARYIDENKAEKALGACELRIYETGLVVISEGGNFNRIPYSDLARIQIEKYKLVLYTDYEESFIFSQMGKELDICFRMLNDLINKLSQKVQTTLKELFPQYDSSVIRKAARLMKDGRAARCIDIEAISPRLWVDLEDKLDALGIKEEYVYLKSLAQTKSMCIGIKRGLMGDLTGEYIWFLAPIFNSDHTLPGNTIAMEATTGEGSGKATYFFKICERDRYLSFRNMAEIQMEADKALKRMNRNLVTINFRREPIYLT